MQGDTSFTPDEERDKEKGRETEGVSPNSSNVVNVSRRSLHTPHPARMLTTRRDVGLFPHARVSRIVKRSTPGMITKDALIAINKAAGMFLVTLTEQCDVARMSKKQVAKTVTLGDVETAIRMGGMKFAFLTDAIEVLSFNQSAVHNTFDKASGGGEEGNDAEENVNSNIDDEMNNDINNDDDTPHTHSLTTDAHKHSPHSLTAPGSPTITSTTTTTTTTTATGRAVTKVSGVGVGGKRSNNSNKRRTGGAAGRPTPSSMKTITEFFQPVDRK